MDMYPTNTPGCFVNLSKTIELDAESIRIYSITSKRQRRKAGGFRPIDVRYRGLCLDIGPIEKAQSFIPNSDIQSSSSCIC